MTSMQMNAEILRNISIIAEDEKLMLRVAKFLRKLVKEKQDATVFTHEEFMNRINEARKQPGRQFSSAEELDRFIRSL